MTSVGGSAYRVKDDGYSFSNPECWIDMCSRRFFAMRLERGFKISIATTDFNTIPEKN
jgi:hypothetical protein